MELINYKDKYIKYKIKYFELKNSYINNQIGGRTKNKNGSSFNKLLAKWKKIGFPYAKHFIDEKKNI